MADEGDKAMDERRRRLLYRSSRTGTKETDLLLGGFARRHVPHFSAEQLDRYEDLLMLNTDQDILAWATGQAPAPPEFDHDVMNLLRRFRFEPEQGDAPR